MRMSWRLCSIFRGNLHVRTDLYAASSARLIAALGAGLITTFIAAGLFGSVAPATAQGGYGNVFGYDDHRAEELQQRHNPRTVRRSRAAALDDRNTADKKKKGNAVRHSRAPSSEDHANTAEKKLKKSKNKEAKKSAPQGAVYAIVSLADQHVTIYDSTGRIAQSRISTGMRGHPTPIGLFSIIGKERWHRSNIYSGAPMPFMQRITWSGVAMHLGVVPGYPASHGCIRLPDGFAQQFWGMTQIGNRVVVARRDTTAVEISSTFLPVPKLRPAPEVLPGSQQSALPSSTPVKLASISEASPINAETPPSPATAPKLLNPIEYAKALKERALASKAAADQAAKDDLRAAQAAGVEAHQAGDDVNKAVTALRAAEAKLAALDAAAQTATAGAPPATPPDGTQAVRTRAAPSLAAMPGAPAANAAAEAASATAEAAAQGDVDRARAALVEAQSREATKRQGAFAAVQICKDAVAAGELAANTAKEAERRLKPASVLFSKKEGRVFIRQDRKEVYEAPISFKDPDRPIGTHLFIAVNSDADGKVKWSAISVPSGSTASDDPPRQRSKNHKSADPAPGPAPQDYTASAALERVQVADNVRERIAELVWVGAQVIVTDNARSDEMDSDTDIIVSTR
jgi:lipoprotein-anchoring transpeptidase ErfK/SrfK